jgi:hypothetical protein
MFWKVCANWPRLSTSVISELVKVRYSACRVGLVRSIHSPPLCESNWSTEVTRPLSSGTISSWAPLRAAAACSMIA